MVCGIVLTCRRLHECATSGGRRAAKLQIRIRKTRISDSNSNPKPKYCPTLWAQAGKIANPNLKNQISDSESNAKRKYCLALVGAGRPNCKPESETSRFPLRNEIRSGNQTWTSSGLDIGRAHYHFRIGFFIRRGKLTALIVGCGQYCHFRRFRVEVSDLDSNPSRK